jgi:hypothetical protein
MLRIWTELHRKFSRTSRGLAAGLLILCSFAAPLAQAQMPPGGGMPAKKSAAPDPFIASTSRWDANHDGILTCDEWRQYLNRLFMLADKNTNGFLDATEFQHVGKLEPIFAGADFSYFDDNHDGRVSRAEFVEKPSPFFARYDLNRDCRVTSEEMTGPRGAPAGGGPKGGGGPGMGGSRGTF